MNDEITTMDVNDADEDVQVAAHLLTQCAMALHDSVGDFTLKAETTDGKVIEIAIREVGGDGQ